MSAGWWNRIRIKNLFARRKSGILVILIILILIVDGALGWYIISYSVADKDVDETPLDFEILQLERSVNNLVLVRSVDSVHMILDTPVEMQFSGLPTDITLGDNSNAIAILTDDHVLHYFSPGQTTELFSFELEDAVDLIGICETYSSMGYQPERIVATTSNETVDAVHVISIDERGIEWTHTFNSTITRTARSDNTGYFSIALDDDKVVHFARYSSTPRITFQISGEVNELRTSGSGTYLVVLFDNGSEIVRYSITSPEPMYTADLPSGSKNLQIRGKSQYSYVQTGEEVLEIENGNVRSKLVKPGLLTYTVPTVTDRIYVSVPGEIQGYDDGRGAPNWKASSTYDVTNLGTDVSGAMIIGWNDQDISFIDDSSMPLGNDGLWYLLGFVVIFETLFLMVYVWWDEFRKTRKETLYILVVGAIAGIIVSYVLPDQEAIDWFGLTAYITLAAALASLSTLVSWRTEAGAANIVIGLVVGIIAAIPLALLAHFLMEVAGYQFPDSPFFSLAKLIYTGLKMGIVGGVIGWVAQRFVRG